MRVSVTTVCAAVLASETVTRTHRITFAPVFHVTLDTDPALRTASAVAREMGKGYSSTT